MTVADVTGVEARRADVRRRPGELAGAARGGHRRTRTRATPPTRRRSATCSSASAARPRARPTTSLVVNSDDVILDDIWAWRADHGNGVGWTANTADTGVIVNGDDVTAYGLFVEHYQKYETIWNGQNGQGRLLPERDAVRPAEPGGLDGGARRPRLGRLQDRRRRDQLQRLRDGQLQLLQPGRRHLRRERVRGARHPARREPQRPAHDLPRSEPTARAASST